MNAPRRSQPTGLSVSHTMLLRRLESIASLSEEDRRALAALPIQESNFEADRDIVREHDHPSRSFVLVEGFVYAYKVTGDGKRQITGLYLAGDFPDLLGPAGHARRSARFTDPTGPRAGRPAPRTPRNLHENAVVHSLIHPQVHCRA